MILGQSNFFTSIYPNFWGNLTPLWVFTQNIGVTLFLYEYLLTKYWGNLTSLWVFTQNIGGDLTSLLVFTQTIWVT